MEYTGKCFTERRFAMKSRKCKIRIVAAYILLIAILTFSIAVYSYAGESLTLEQAVDTALRNNPGLKAADEQVRAADAGVLRSASGFLPTVTLSETLSRTDNPMIPRHEAEPGDRNAPGFRA